MKKILLAAWLIAVPSLARAQANEAQAEQLFRDGRAAMAARDYPGACRDFAASDRLDPAATTKMNLAACREKTGQIATAWGLYLEVARTTRDDPKQKALTREARAHAEALEARLSYLIVLVRDEANVDGLTITMDGKPIDPLTWNTSLPVDGGDYVIEAKAPGHEPWSTTVHVDPEGVKQSVDVPRFKDVPVAVATPAPPPAPAPKPAPVAVDDDEELTMPAHGLGARRELALGLGGGGVLAGVGAIVLELAAGGSYDDALHATDAQARAQLVDRANLERGLAIGAGVVGVAALGAGAYLWLTGARPDERAVAIAPLVGAHTVGVALVLTR